MNDRQTDMTFVNSIYEASEICCFNDELRELLLLVIKELCTTQKELMTKLRIEHVDRAIAKYVYAKGKRQIWNTKQYFKECILSAIRELGIDEIYSEEITFQ